MLLLGELADLRQGTIRALALSAPIFITSPYLSTPFVFSFPHPLGAITSQHLVVAVSIILEAAMAPPDENSGENHLRFDEPKFDGDGENGRKPSGAEQKGSIYAKPDLENGEEYANLVAYISSYYEGPRRKSVVSMEGGDAPKKPWWKFWSRSSAAGGSGDGSLEIPDDVSLCSLKQRRDQLLTRKSVAGGRYQARCLNARGRESS